MTRRALPVLAGLVAACALSAWYAFQVNGIGADYGYDAAAPIGALARGDLGEFFDYAPLMGSFSLVLRAPLAALAGADDLLSYRLGALVCLLPLGLLAVWLERLMAERGQPLGTRLVVAGLCLVNPLTADAILWGHPEELLCAALCVGAVVAMLRDRPVAAAVLLGLALATKQWAVLAILPVLLAARGRQVRPLVIGGGVAAALLLPLLVANPGSFLETMRAALGATPGSGSRVGALEVWWPFATERELAVSDGVGTVAVTRYSLPDGFITFTRILIVGLALPLSALFWRRRAQLQRQDVLALLALLFLLRCALDPQDNEYYHLPFLVALAAWEGLRRQGLPLVTMLAATAMWLVFDQLAPPSGYGATTAMYLAWVVPLTAWLALWLYAPRTVSALGKRLRISQPSSVTMTRSSIRTPKAPAT